MPQTRKKMSQAKLGADKPELKHKAGLKARLGAFARLSRIDHAFFLIVAVVVGELIAGLPAPHIILISALVPFLIEIGSFALNDFMDLQTDLLNRRYDRPLVRGDLTPRAAFLAARTFLPLGVAIAAFLNFQAFCIAAVFALLSIAYSGLLKKKPLAGNFTVAACMAIPFLFGNIVSTPGQLSDAVLVLAAMSFLMGYGRELFKSVQDLHGDIRTGRRTLPALIGAKPARTIASVFVLAAIGLSFVPYVSLEFTEFYNDTAYAAPILLTNLLLLAGVLHAFKNNYKKTRGLTLAAQATGLLGFLLGAAF